MLGITLNRSEKIGLAIGGGILGMIVLAPTFFKGGSSAPLVTGKELKARKRSLDAAEKRIEQLECEIERLKARAETTKSPAVRHRAESRLAQAEESVESLEEKVERLAHVETYTIKGTDKKYQKDTIDLEQLSKDELNELISLTGGGSKRRRKNPATLGDAQSDSETFHGEPRETVKLSADERREASPYATVIGRVTSIDYVTPDGSQRSGSIWDHKMGDGGPYGQSKKDPLLVEDPETHLLYFAEDGARTHFSPDMGILF